MLKLISIVVYLAVGFTFGWTAALALLAAHMVLLCIAVIFGGSK